MAGKAAGAVLSLEAALSVCALRKSHGGAKGHFEEIFRKRMTDEFGKEICAE